MGRERFGSSPAHGTARQRIPEGHTRVVDDESRAEAWDPLADPDLVAHLQAEGSEHLDTVELGLLELEGGEDAAAYEQLLRVFHTLKGHCGGFGLQRLEEIAHLAEAFLQVLQREPRRRMVSAKDLVFDVVDGLREAFAQLADRAADDSGLRLLSQRLRQAIERDEPETADDDFGPGDALLVGDARLGDLLVAAGMVSRASLETCLAAAPAGEPLGRLVVRRGLVSARQVAWVLRHQQKDRRRVRRGVSTTAMHGIRRRRPPTVRIRADRMTSLFARIDAMTRSAEALRAGMDDAELDTHRLLCRQTRDLAATLRWSPIRPVFQRMARLARDLGHRLGRALCLRIDGDDLELDRAVVDHLDEPLTHLVRNAIDHGLEDAEERREAGKDPVGTVTLRALRDAGRLVLEVGDDGRGLDPRRLLRRGRSLGLVAADEVLDEQACLALIWRPGFSTAPAVTEISGRGVGMDVVKSAVEAVGGRLELAGAMGRGTTVRIVLPAATEAPCS